MKRWKSNPEVNRVLKEGARRDWFPVSSSFEFLTSRNNRQLRLMRTEHSSLYILQLFLFHHTFLIVFFSHTLFFLPCPPYKCCLIYIFTISLQTSRSSLSSSSGAYITLNSNQSLKDVQFIFFMFSVQQPDPNQPKPEGQQMCPLEGEPLGVVTNWPPSLPAALQRWGTTQPKSPCLTALDNAGKPVYTLTYGRC